MSVLSPTRRGSNVDLSDRFSKYVTGDGATATTDSVPPGHIVTPGDAIEMIPRSQEELHSATARKTSVAADTQAIDSATFNFKLKKMMTQYVPACAAYCLCSASMVYSNKALLTLYDFNHPLSLLFFQNMMCVFLVVSAKALGLVHYDDFSRETAIKWLPVNVFFCLMLATGSLSLKYMTVPMVTIFKNLTNIGITFGDKYMFGQEVSPWILFALLLMVIGSILGAKSDIFFTVHGYFWMMLNCVFSAAYVLYMRLAMKTTKLGEFGMVFYNNLLSVPFLTIFVLVSQERDLWTEVETKATTSFVAVTIFSCVVGFSLSLSSFWCVRVTSPTTYSITGSLNKIPLTVLSILIFDLPVSALGALSLVIGLSGGLVYSWAKTRTHMAKKKDEEEKV
eukprot:GFYU01007872.1.p1 GENE.GFYU01007872.1~~GFYU01007872.1.p1  ORF type:complete len:394 (-),score=55.86 GFYU01007872.1:245-1426(-)